MIILFFGNLVDNVLDSVLVQFVSLQLHANSDNTSFFAFNDEFFFFALLQLFIVDLPILVSFVPIDILFCNLFF